MVEPAAPAWALITLRAAEERRPAPFEDLGRRGRSGDGRDRRNDHQASRWGTSTRQRSGYQEALREPIEAKMKGLPVKAKRATAPSP